MLMYGLLLLLFLLLMFVSYSHINCDGGILKSRNVKTILREGSFIVKGGGVRRAMS